MVFYAKLLRRPCTHIGTLIICLLVAKSSTESPCTLESQLNYASKIDSGGKLTLITGRCALLDPESESFNITANTTLRGGSDGLATLDTNFAAKAVLAHGYKVTLEQLRLENALVEVSPLLVFPAFEATLLKLSHVVVETDCRSLSALSDRLAPKYSVGPGYVYVSTYSSQSVQAVDVNITCEIPTFATDVGGSFISVNDGLQLLNALAVSQSQAASAGAQDPLTILVNQNISLTLALWQRTPPLRITRSVTIKSSGSGQMVLDLQGAVGAVTLDTGAYVTLDNLYLMNVGPLRGVLRLYGMLPLFSIPLWFFDFVRRPDAPQITLTNVTVALPPTEYSYTTVWTVVQTTSLGHISESAAELRSNAPIIKPSGSTNTTLSYGHLRANGLDMYDTNLTWLVPPTPFPSRVLDNPNLHFNLNVLPNLTHLPIYNLPDLMKILNAMQTSPPPFRTALYILANITIDPSIWPAAGFNVTKPLLLVGQNNMGLTTWIDFQRVPRFVRGTGCAPEMYLYAQGLQFLNLPNGLAQPAGSPMGAAPAGSGAGAGLNDLTLFLSNFQAANTCQVPLTFINQSSLVVTYAEFSRLYSVVMATIGKSDEGVHVALNATITYTLKRVVSNSIVLERVYGWGWSGYLVNVTYVFPSGVRQLYNNVFAPLAPPEGQGFQLPVPVGSPPSHVLVGWQVAVIVVGAVTAVVLLGGLVGWRIVRKLRHEVEAVKSASNSDKKSCSGSGENDGVGSGGVGGAPGPDRLGSNAAAGGSQRGNGGGGSPSSPLAAAVAKGSMAMGTSDESAGQNDDKPPLEVLNGMMASLTQEMEDSHLTILEAIGQGGFGVVYRGTWKGLNVAVKTITFQDRVAGGEKAQHRAILEAAISSSLSHPNVVTTYSYDIKPLTVQSDSNEGPPNSGKGSGIRIVDKRTVLDWKLYLIQEFCDGGSLRNAVLKRKFFDSKKNEPRMEMLLDTCLELTGGLVHLHERNIIHGDLNPNNVLLKRDASKKYGAVCKIADFGLSIKMGADQSHISNMRRGTPFYTCPQILARGNMTKAADVYSMGVMMWEMYHCCMSYRSLPSGFTARENFPNFPRKAPYDFSVLVGSCLSSEPAQRPTFSALSTELEHLLAAHKRGELRSCEDILGPDEAGDAAHFAACQD